MFMYKAGILLSVELVVIAIGFYFFYLAKREDSKHLKIGAYILVIGGILLALTTAGMTIKKMACKKKQCERMYHHGGGYWEGKRQCLDKEKGEGREDREEREQPED